MSLTIGEKIAALRKAKNITQTQLAEYLFLVPQTISKWEVGNGTPDVTLLPRIAAFFGVSMDELFGRSPVDRAIDLVLRYSVLRDDVSFREAMDCLDSQLQTIDRQLENSIGDTAELERDKIRLESVTSKMARQSLAEMASLKMSKAINEVATISKLFSSEAFAEVVCARPNISKIGAIISKTIIPKV